MPDLILRPSTLVEGKPWALQLRYHESVGPTEYFTITRVSDELGRSIVDAGAPFFLFGDPKEELAHALPPDVVALVIAAREFWDVNNDLSEESQALDKALERFAEKVPYENHPDDASKPTGGDHVE
ncbi:UNVERIFIED_ORG: putative circularly permuted ATP-grasp superfamily protein [Shinella zoogloeoides]|nr:putative circularly permuted ATP-grasp superfamily protein [Shinella zoogloeoides]